MFKYLQPVPEQGRRPETPNLEVVYEQPDGDSTFSLLLNLGQYESHQEQNDALLLLDLRHDCKHQELKLTKCQIAYRKRKEREQRIEDQLDELVQIANEQGITKEQLLEFVQVQISNSNKNNKKSHK